MMSALILAGFVVLTLFVLSLVNQPRLAVCDHCGKKRPWWWARRHWPVLGGVAGYYDFCSRLCELGHLKQSYRST